MNQLEKGAARAPVNHQKKGAAKHNGPIMGAFSYFSFFRKTDPVLRFFRGQNEKTKNQIHPKNNLIYMPKINTNLSKWLISLSI